jgi:glycosylphosphatidylinositol transamidase (GPIT) subunit GPI8
LTVFESKNMKKVIILALVVAAMTAIASAGVSSNNEGTNWALLAAGSKTWSNYSMCRSNMSI